MSTSTVIVFGPTGAVGSVVARTAAGLGVKVILAMRDTNKKILDLDENSGTFERVQADLTKSDTVVEAVKSTGAKAAFIYLAMTSLDGMRSTAEALKTAGIERVVFLSSFTVRGDLAAIKPTELIPYAHARVDMNLEEIFGAENVMSVRPGAFASNSLQYLGAIQTGTVKVLNPSGTLDCITPGDIGGVAGTLLVNGSKDGDRQFYLYGPNMVSQGDTVRLLAKALGQEADIQEATEEEAYIHLIEDLKMPQPMAKYVLSQQSPRHDEDDHVFGYSTLDKEKSMVEKYLERKGETYEQWVAQKAKHLGA